MISSPSKSVPNGNEGFPILKKSPLTAAVALHWSAMDASLSRSDNSSEYTGFKSVYRSSRSILRTSISTGPSRVCLLMLICCIPWERYSSLESSIMVFISPPALIVKASAIDNDIAKIFFFIMSTPFNNYVIRPVCNS